MTTGRDKVELYQRGTDRYDPSPVLRIARTTRISTAFGAYRVPIFIPGARRFAPATLRVWGAVRPASNRSTQTVQVQFRGSARGAKWRTRQTVKTRNARNYVDTRVRFSRSGSVRLRWRAPGGSVLYSRAAGVRIG